MLQFKLTNISLLFFTILFLGSCTKEASSTANEQIVGAWKLQTVDGQTLDEIYADECNLAYTFSFGADKSLNINSSFNCPDETQSLALILDWEVEENTDPDILKMSLESEDGTGHLMASIVKLDANKMTIWTIGEGILGEAPEVWEMQRQ